MTSIAHVGYGYWGGNIARNLAEIGVLGAIIDADPAAAAAGAARLGVRAATFEQALDDSSIDAVSIASPAELHFVHASAALEAGKHVFVEKPLALRVADAEALCAMAERNGRRLMVGHLLQYHPAYATLRRMVAAGELGRIRHVSSSRLSLGKFRREEDVLWSFAPHDISMLLGLFGAEPLTVGAQGQVVYSPGVADIVTLQMRFPGGGTGHVHASWTNPFKEHRLVVIGEDATAVFEDSAPDWRDKLKLYRHRIDRSGPIPVAAKADAERVAIAEAEPLKEECRHFIRCIEEGRAPLTDGAEGLRVLGVLDRAARALAGDLALERAGAREAAQ